jgi:hypothetical protein
LRKRGVVFLVLAPDALKSAEINFEKGRPGIWGKALVLLGADREETKNHRVTLVRVHAALDLDLKLGKG